MYLDKHNIKIFLYLNIKVNPVWYKIILYKCFKLQYLVMCKFIAQEYIHNLFFIYINKDLLMV